MTRGFRYFIYGIGVTILGLSLLEGLLRLAGKRPYCTPATSIESSPGNLLSPHQQLGIGLIPGTFSVSINGDLPYTCTHLEDSTRLVGSASSLAKSPSKKLFLYGCSLTYGMGVDDTCTFAYQMQKALPDWQIRNFGVPAYGTVQSLLQLQQQLTKESPPDLVFLHYSSLHDARNKLSPAQQKYWQDALSNIDTARSQLFASANFPYVSKLRKEFDIRYLNIRQMKKRWRWSYFLASLYAIEVLCDHLLDGFHDKALYSQKTLLAFADLCQAHEIPLVVAGMTDDEDTRKMLAFCRSHAIDTLNPGVDIRQPAFNLQPYDSHPNALAHWTYARYFIDYIRYFTLQTSR